MNDSSSDSSSDLPVPAGPDSAARETSHAVAARLVRRRGDYGFDAPYVPAILDLIGVALLAMGAAFVWVVKSTLGGAISLVYGIFWLLSTASYIYTTRAGKFRVWAATRLVSANKPA